MEQAFLRMLKASIGIDGDFDKDSSGCGSSREWLGLE